MDLKITITRTVGRGKELLADEGLVLHNRVTGQWLSRRAMVFDNPEDYEAVEEPKYTREQYEEKVNELIREHYTESQEFAILRKRDAVMLSSVDEEAASKAAAEYESYYNYCEECKVRAKEILSEPIVEQIEEEEKIDYADA